MSRLTKGVECPGPGLSLCLDEPHIHRFDGHTVRAQTAIHLAAQTSGVGQRLHMSCRVLLELTEKGDNFFCLLMFKLLAATIFIDVLAR